MSFNKANEKRDNLSHIKAMELRRTHPCIDIVYFLGRRDGREGNMDYINLMLIQKKQDFWPHASNVVWAKKGDRNVPRVLSLCVWIVWDNMHVLHIKVCQAGFNLNNIGRQPIFGQRDPFTITIG